MSSAVVGSGASETGLSSGKEDGLPLPLELADSDELEAIDLT